MKPKKESILIIGEDAGTYDKDARHPKYHYKAKKTKNKDGSIDIKLIPKTKDENRRTELIESLSEKLKDQIDNKELMKDILTDVTLVSLEKIDKALNRGAKIKAKEGCYYLEIKDPRRKKPMNLTIRK